MQTAFNFWNRLKNGVSTIVFTKLDGSPRTMKCTLDFSRIPAIDKPKGVNIERIVRLADQQGYINVYDVENKGWRSVPFREVLFL